MSSKINLLFVGDVVGEAGLKAIREYLRDTITKYNANFVIVNGENATNGKGLTETEAKLIFDCGANVITTGNHIWDNWKSKTLLANNHDVLRPLNYPPGNPGMGFCIKEFESGVNIGVLQIQGRTFMNSIDCPFRAADYALKIMEEKTSAIIVDFHADATAEKYSMAWYLDGKVSALLGTHTHIPTADACILPNGTAYITDVGMTGPYDSVVGLKKEIAMKRFLLQTPHKYEIAEKDVRICGVHLEIETSTGQAIKIEQIIYPDFEREVNFTANY